MADPKLNDADLEAHLSKLNDADLAAFAAGKMDQISEEGLKWIANPQLPPGKRSWGEDIWTELTKGRQGTTPYNSPVSTTSPITQSLALMPMALGAGITAEGGNALNALGRAGSAVAPAAKAALKYVGIPTTVLGGAGALWRRLNGK